MAASSQYCTFFVDGLYLGIEVQRVQEVIRYQDMTQVPLAPGMVSGLINLRGQIVTALDLRCRLDLAPRDRDHLPMNVVVHDDDGAVSLLVDQIGDVTIVDPSDCERPPASLSGSARDLVQSVYKLADGLLLVLDVDRTLGTQPEAADAAPQCG